MVTDEQVESLVKQISEMQEQVLRKNIRAMLEAFHDDRASNADKKLTKPARVGNTKFGVGVPERIVIERAQLEHEYHNSPEEIANRVARVKEFNVRG